jgi:DNA-3-methyladenine glycosylase I
LAELNRCAWAGADPLMQAYHDEEWGAPQRDSRVLWEMLALEGFQAGLAWITVLRKREAFRTGFAGFDPRKVAAFDAADVERLMADTGIIRARAKIEATISGARIWCGMEDTGESFSDWCWSFTDGQVVVGDGETMPASTPLSETISKAMKQRGFKFIGPTIAYAWMQAVGIANDHQVRCFRHNETTEMSCITN